MRCLAYKLYDRFKRSWFATKFIFHGQRYQHFEDITVEGVVVDRPKDATDGDDTFNLNDGQQNWHCEVVPCASPELVAAAKALQPGMHVKVSGTRTWDPGHLNTAGHWEIHPVDSIEIL